jgi:hypothetical protein
MKPIGGLESDHQQERKDQKTDRKRRCGIEL